MQIRVQRLRDTLKLLEPVVPRKTTLPILVNVLLKDGKAHATDLQSWVSLELPEVDKDCLLPHRTISELLENVPGDEELTIDVKEKGLKLSWSGGKAAYDASDPKDYPSIPAAKSEAKSKAQADIDGDSLVTALADMAPYCSTDESRPVLNGVALLLGPKMAVAAGDGFRMGYQEIPLFFPLEKTVDIHHSSVKILANLWKKCPPAPGAAATLVSLVTSKRQLRLWLSDNVAGFRFGKVGLLANLIEGEPPNFKQLIPTPSNRIRLFAPDFERALRRIKNVADNANGIARLAWANSVMTVSAKAEEKGEIEATLPAVTDDGPGKIAVNIKYLLEYCSKKEDFFTMGITTPQAPMLFTYRNSPTVVMMPMFVQW